jgi:hypothetical protein
MGCPLQNKGSRGTFPATMRPDKDPVAKPPIRTSVTQLRFGWAHGAFFILGMLAAALVAFLVPFKGRGSHLSPANAGTRVPWGTLAYTPIRLEQPDPPAHSPAPIRWVFEGFSREQVESLFRASDLTAAQRESLLDKSRWQTSSNAWDVLPPPEVVRDLSQAARRAIYAALQKSARNPHQQYPFHIEAEQWGRWLAESGLPEEKQALIQRLAFVEGRTVAFYDVPLLEWLSSPEEIRCLTRALSQVSALLMTLRITPDSDIDALERYWGRGRHGQSMKPFLESLAHVPDEISVSVSFFFPTFARMRLYTYPNPAIDRIAPRQDCFWTALNFLSEEPDNRFLDEKFVERTLKTDYSEVKTNWAFGDLVLLLGKGQTAFHLCVYIADDVVFTKNGVDLSAPWVLMKIPDMLAFYDAKKPIELVGLRRKDAPTGVAAMPASSKPPS